MNDKFTYKYSVDQCDIIDKKNAEAFRIKRLNWIQLLFGEDPHAITRQISALLWSYVLFSVVNELRKIGDSEPKEGVGFNGPVISLFDVGFVTMQTTAIRRLIEKPKEDPAKAVISLRGILKELHDNVHLFTRENYVCYDGLPYDYVAAHQQWLSTLPEGTEHVHGGWLPSSGPAAWHMSELVHESFDRLSERAPTNRKRTDTIKTEVFSWLESQLSRCENIKTYVDKFIAHAAAPETRAGLSDEQRGITLDGLKQNHKIIYQVTNFISSRLLYISNLGGLPTPQFDHLENLDKSWATTRDLNGARQKWHDYAKEISKWDSISPYPSDFPRNATTSS